MAAAHYAKKAVSFFTTNNLKPHKEKFNGSEWLVVPFTSYGLYEEFNNTIGRYMSSPMTFMCQTNELRILL